MKNPSIAKLAKAAGSPMKFGVGASPMKKEMTKEQLEDTGAQTNYKEDTKKKSGPDWSKAPKLNTQARRDWYTKNNLAQDATTELKTTTPKKTEPNKTEPNKTEPKKTEPKKTETKTTKTKSRKISLRPRLGKGVETLKKKNKRKYGGKRVYNPRLNRFE